MLGEIHKAIRQLLALQLARHSVLEQVRAKTNGYIDRLGPPNRKGYGV